MRELPYPADGQRLLHAIYEELTVQYGMAGSAVDDKWITTLAEMIAARIEYGFGVTWRPTWVRPGDPHRWVEASEHHVECLACRQITAHESQSSADVWWSNHSLIHRP
jgi:hypothetical protein